SEERHFTDPDNARLAHRLRKQRAHRFTFLYLDGVEPTNNRAERMLRPAVLTRKTGGCNRSPPGARIHEVLASLLVTMMLYEFLPELALKPSAYNSVTIRIRARS